MDAHSEARLQEVHPQLAAKIRTLATMLATEDIEIRVTQGFRTWAQQHALYLQGRVDLLEVNACRLNCGLAKIDADENYKVTDADSGYSWHNYGLAVDVAPFVNGFPVWGKKAPDDALRWSRIVTVGQSLGLRSGVSWKDTPHFELTGIFGAKPPEDVVSLYRAANDNGSGSKAIWDAAQISV